MDNKMGARAKRCMMTGYVRNTTGIWRLWDMESRRIIECSDVKFDEDSMAYSEDSTCNEGDPLGLPPEKPIYEEVQVEGPISKVAPEEVTTSTPDEVVAAMSDPKGTHKQEKALSESKGTHEQRNATSDPKGTHEQKNAKRKKEKDKSTPSVPTRRSTRIQGQAATGTQNPVVGGAQDPVST